MMSKTVTAIIVAVVVLLLLLLIAFAPARQPAAPEATAPPAETAPPVPTLEPTPSPPLTPEQEEAADLDADTEALDIAVEDFEGDLKTIEAEL